MFSGCMASDCEVAFSVKGNNESTSLSFGSRLPRKF
jgi:hypothetical protein